MTEESEIRTDAITSGSGGAGIATSDLLARGAAMLERLSREAQAARAEARQAELQQLLADARRGRPQELEVWLKRYDQGHRLAHSPADNLPAENLPADNRPAEVLPAKAPASGSSAGVSAASSIDSGPPDTAGAGWQTMLEAARERLAIRRDQLRGGLAQASPKSEKRPRDNDSHPRAGQTNRRRGRPPPSVQPRSRPAASQPSSMQLTASTELTRDGQSTLQTVPQQQVASRSRWRGLVASVLLHLLLIVLLGLMTLQLPEPPAGIVLESSALERVAETVEISPQLDVPVPDRQPMPVPEVAVDLPDNLADLSPTISQTLAENAARPTASLASAALVTGTNPLPAASSFFGAAAHGNCFCYVIDSSSSMKGGAWEAAKSELLRSLASLKENQRFYIIFFNTELRPIPMPGEREPAGRALYANAKNIAHARNWIDTIRISKGAPPSAALGYAVDLEPDAIYFLTDGVTKTDLPKFLREKNRVDDVIDGEQVKVTIHAIAFYSLAGQALMRQVAKENRGEFVYVPNPQKK